MKSISSPTTVRFADSYASVLLDLLRGVAAFLVFAEHWRNIFFLDFPQLTGHRTLWIPMYLATSLGHAAVVVFFVLSGYFIGGAVFRSLEKGNWSWIDFLLRRLVRLWIVLLPALLLCTLWDRAGIALNHAPLLYHGGATNHMLGNVSDVLTPRIFIANFFFLHEILAPTYGSDGALWSLAYEFWYYMLFPLGLLALRRKSSLPSRLIHGALFLAVVWFVRGSILNSFPIWLLGVVLFLVKPPAFSERVAARIRILSSIVYVLLFLVAARVHVLPALATDYLLAVATFVYVWLLLSARKRAGDSLSVRASRQLARFSFSLYVLHTPLLIFLVAMLVGDGRWAPSAATLAIGAGVLIVTFGYAYGVAWLTEFRTDAFRIRLERLIGIRPERPVLSSNPALDQPAGAGEPVK